MRKYKDTFYKMSGVVTTVYSYGRDKYIIIDNGKNSIPVFTDQEMIDDVSKKQKELALENKELMLQVCYDQFYRVCHYKTVKTCDNENDDEPEYQYFDMQEEAWMKSI